MKDGVPSLKRFEKSSRSSSGPPCTWKPSRTMSWKVQLAEPLVIEADLRLLLVENLEDLRLVVLGVLGDLSGVSGGRVRLRPVGSPIRPVPSPIRKMTVCEILEVLHLAQQHPCGPDAGRARSVKARLTPRKDDHRATIERSRRSPSRIISEPFLR